MVRNVLSTAVLLNTSGKQMNNNWAACFKRIYFAVIPSYVELPWSRNTTQLSMQTKLFNPLMHNVPKWSETLSKSWSKCFKIFNVCLTSFGRYIKGLIF